MTVPMGVSAMMYVCVGEKRATRGREGRRESGGVVCNQSVQQYRQCCRWSLQLRSRGLEHGWLLAVERGLSHDSPSVVVTFEDRGERESSQTFIIKHL